MKYDNNAIIPKKVKKAAIYVQNGRGSGLGGSLTCGFAFMILGVFVFEDE